MTYENVRSDEEIDDLLNDCMEADESGTSRFPGSMYEQGVQYAIEWLIGQDDTHPLEQ